MHPSGTVTLGCATCHGGDPAVSVAAGLAVDTDEYKAAKKQAHPQPRVSDLWKSAANPVRAYTQWLEESPEYIRFVNPGDLRVADKTCGTCHAAEVRNVRTSMMTTGAMLWQAALYNNGAAPFKNARFGESYAPDGTPQRLQAFPAPTAEETKRKGWLPFLEPLPRWEVTQPGNVLRAFERGGGRKAEIGNPTKAEEPGRPDVKLSDRGFGTALRTDPVFLGLQKTRLLDPLLSFPGTNDQPGDYRNSGCTSCHVVYANDRSPDHSAQYAAFGNEGRTQTADPTIDPKRVEPGHPITHTFTRSIPSSQCMTCHIHPGTNMVTTYYGYTWWENETDGEQMYPAEPHRRSARRATGNPQPESRAVGAARATGATRSSSARPARRSSTRSCSTRSSPTSTATAGSTARSTSATAAATCSTRTSKIVPHEDPERFGKAVHLKDIHLEKGMQCVDCHFGQDNHGNGKLYGETRNAIEIDCVDCHGTIDKRADPDHERPRGARGRHRARRAAHAVARAPLRLGRRSALPALDDGSRASSGRSSRPSTRSRPGRRTTASSRATRRRFRRTARPGDRRARPSRRTSWRTRTAR